MDELTPGRRVYLRLWRTSYRDLTRHPDGRIVAEAAAHALLARLRAACPTAPDLWRHYDDGSDADFALIASLIRAPPDARTLTEEETRLYPVREAAFWLRWRELAGGDP